jgi:hypothetical protein
MVMVSGAGMARTGRRMGVLDCAEKGGSAGGGGRDNSYWGYHCGGGIDLDLSCVYIDIESSRLKAGNKERKKQKEPTPYIED